MKEKTKETVKGLAKGTAIFLGTMLFVVPVTTFAYLTHKDKDWFFKE